MIDRTLYPRSIQYSKIKHLTSVSNSNWSSTQTPHTKSIREQIYFAIQLEISCSLERREENTMRSETGKYEQSTEEIHSHGFL